MRLQESPAEMSKMDRALNLADLPAAVRRNALNFFLPTPRIEVAPLVSPTIK